MLKKALYGLKQTPKAWYNKMDRHLMSLGFEKSLSESTLYIKKMDFDLIIVSLYVNDLLVTSGNEAQITVFKQNMMKMFEMTDLGEISYFLAMEIKQAQNNILKRLSDKC